MKEYLQYVEKESRTYFDREIAASEAASSIDLGPYADWLCPERIYMNVERAVREFRGEALRCDRNYLCHFQFQSEMG